MRFDEGDLSRDAFLGGRVLALQPRRGYRAGIDPVLLAAAVAARPGQSVLELGCGAGIASLCLGARVPDLALRGIELQPAYADLARRNAAAAGLDFEIHAGDLRALPQPLRQMQFDHVIANPPYFEAARGLPSKDAGRDLALRAEMPLSEWVGAAARRLRPGGRALIIQRAERLPELLAAFAAALGSLELWPLAPRRGRAATRVLLRGRMGGRAPFRLHPPLVLHEGSAHPGDGRADYSPAVAAALGEGAALEWPG